MLTLLGQPTIERLRNQSEDMTKTQMTQLFNQYSESETKIWCQNILPQFSSCLCSHFVISLKATSHSTIFDIPMRPVHEDQRHR